MVSLLWFFTGVVAFLVAFYATIPFLVAYCGRSAGSRIRSRTQQTREVLRARAAAEQKRDEDRGSQATLDDEWEKIDQSRSHSSPDLKSIQDDTRDWDGIVGFFHPFCNAGGGGERVLWAAIRATQEKWPKALCAVYTGDHDTTKEQILSRVQERFNITLQSPTITFLHLSTIQYVLSSSWPYFTLLGQSLGSLVLGFDAFNLLVPDVFVDTMGYAFTLSLCKFLFPDVPTGAYVHYPTISTDMLDSLSVESASGKGVNAGAGKGLRGLLKRQYWHLFARLYGWVGGSTDVVMTNSSWTQSHIEQLWGKARQRRGKEYGVEVVFPPVAVEELEAGIVISRENEDDRRPTLLYIAQFRPEKNHQLIIKSFARFVRNCHPDALTSTTSSNQDAPRDSARIPHLTLIGSVRDAADEKLIYSLRLLVHELRITEHVTFVLNATWDAILSELRTATIGVNGMWNEHFGIGVVEYQAAGLIGVVHDSGGPKRDICIEMGDGEGGSGPTGIHASDVDGFAAGFEQVLAKMDDEQRYLMRLRARRSSRRFSGGEFDRRWLAHMERLIRLRTKL